MFDLNDMPIPMTPEFAPLQCASLMQRLLGDLSELDNRPYEITFSAHCFDVVPRTWTFTPLSVDDEQVFGPAEAHKITVDVRDMFGDESLCIGSALLQRPSDEQEDWNSDTALVSISLAMMEAWATATAAVLKEMFTAVGFDYGLFMEVTDGNVSESETHGVLMAWGAIYEMARSLSDPGMRAECDEETYTLMSEKYEYVVARVTAMQEKVVSKATDAAMRRILEGETK